MKDYYFSSISSISHSIWGRQGVWENWDGHHIESTSFLSAIRDIVKINIKITVLRKYIKYNTCRKKYETYLRNHFDKLSFRMFAFDENPCWIEIGDKIQSGYVVTIIREFCLRFGFDEPTIKIEKTKYAIEYNRDTLCINTTIPGFGTIICGDATDRDCKIEYEEKVIKIVKSTCYDNKQPYSGPSVNNRGVLKEPDGPLI